MGELNLNSSELISRTKVLTPLSTEVLTSKDNVPVSPLTMAVLSWNTDNTYSAPLLVSSYVAVDP